MPLPGDTGKPEAKGIRHCVRNVVIVPRAIVVDQAQVGSELPRVLALRPGKIVHEIMDGHIGERRLIGKAAGVIDGAEMNIILRICSSDPQALPHDRISKIVNKIAAEHGGVADCDPFELSVSSWLGGSPGSWGGSEGSWAP